MKKYKFNRSFTFEGKRYFVHGDSEKEVAEKIVLKKRDLEEGKVIIDKSMKVEDWAKICLNIYKPNISDHTKRNHDGILNRYILPVIGKMPLSQVKPLHCQQILNQLTGMSKDTISKTSQLLNLIFRTARDNQLLIVEPTNGIFRPDGTTKHRRAITEAERKALLSVCYSDFKFVPYLFMLLCGCRPAEALSVRANDIQSMDDIIVLHIRGTKTDNADRMVPLPLDFYSYLDKSGVKGFNLYSEKVSGGEHTENSYRNLTRCLKRQMNLEMGARTYRNALIPPLPLAEDFEPYCLRHTYCTDLKKAGVPLSIAKDYMGHADVATTANIYSHSDDDTLKMGASILGFRKTS